MAYMCPKCDSHTRVSRTRLDRNGEPVRHRACKICGHTFVTVELLNKNLTKIQEPTLRENANLKADLEQKDVEIEKLNEKISMLELREKGMKKAMRRLS